jgi:hypothetical protein
LERRDEQVVVERWAERSLHKGRTPQYIGSTKGGR